MIQETLRDDFRSTLRHIVDVLGKLDAHAAPRGTLSDSDLHTLAEGLFVFAFTHWEQFTRNLLIEDLATSPTSMLYGDVEKFRDPEAARRLAIRLLNHPDHPQRFVEWSGYGVIESRANEFLGPDNRFTASPLPRKSDLALLLRVRNAVAHRSDKAWVSFLNLCEDKPFEIPPAQIPGMTPGRFLSMHHWKRPDGTPLNGLVVLHDTLSLLDAAAWHLVPGPYILPVFSLPPLN